MNKVCDRNEMNNIKLKLAVTSFCSTKKQEAAAESIERSVTESTEASSSRTAVN